MTDETYAKLLGRLADRKFDQTSPSLRADILQFYSDLSAPIETKKDNDRWQSVLASLDQLKLVTPTPAVAEGGLQLASPLPIGRANTQIERSLAPRGRTTH